MLTPPLQMLLLMFAGWVNRQQLEVIGYLQRHRRILSERPRAGIRPRGHQHETYVTSLPA